MTTIVPIVLLVIVTASCPIPHYPVYQTVEPWQLSTTTPRHQPPLIKQKKDDYIKFWCWSCHIFTNFIYDIYFPCTCWFLEFESLLIRLGFSWWYKSQFTLVVHFGHVVSHYSHLLWRTSTTYVLPLVIYNTGCITLRT